MSQDFNKQRLIRLPDFVATLKTTAFHIHLGPGWDLSKLTQSSGPIRSRFRTRPHRLSAGLTHDGRSGNIDRGNARTACGRRLGDSLTGIIRAHLPARPPSANQPPPGRAAAADIAESALAAFGNLARRGGPFRGDLPGRVFDVGKTTTMRHPSLRQPAPVCGEWRQDRLRVGGRHVT